MINSEDHIGMVGFVIKKYKFKPPIGYTAKDMFQVGCVGLIKGANSYDPSKTMSGFSPQAHKYIKYELMEVVRKQKYSNRLIDTVTSSYDASNKDVYFPAHPNYDVESSAIASILLQELKDLFKDDNTYLSTMNMILKGYEQKEIAEAIGISVMSVRRRIYKIRETLKKLLQE